MKICIHRGTKQIGGTCIEIEADGKRLVLDIGLPLDSDWKDVALPPVKGFIEKDSDLLGIAISHPHQDHYGLAKKILQDIPVLIGADARKILDAARKFFPETVKFRNTIDLKHRQKINLKPFTITPYLMDHSAYDSYGLLVEACGKRFYYSGDFRGHGRKGRIFNSFIANPPKDVDVLLMEGSTLSRTGVDDTYPEERDLEQRLISVINNTKGMTLVWTSAQNIDRLVTVYRAAKETGRQFIVDMYTAAILRGIGNPNLPQPGSSGFRVYLPYNLKRNIIKSKRFAFAKSFSRYRICPENLAEEASQSVMLCRPSMFLDLEKAKCLHNATLVYSLWAGYLEDDYSRQFVEKLQSHGVPKIHCHTSGHAPIKDLKKMAEAVNPKMLVPVHSFEPDKYQEYFNNVVQKDDGEWWKV